MRAIISLSIRSGILNRLTFPVASLILSISLAILSIAPFNAHAIELPSTDNQAQISESNDSVTTKSFDATFPEDGIYLYGQTPEANQVGVAYAVMEVNNSFTVGAFYMPHSSFDCFYGPVDSQRLDLTVVNSYGQEAYAYSLQLNQQSTVANANGVELVSPNIEGYYPIENLSPTDYEILSTCRANYSSAI